MELGGCRNFPFELRFLFQMAGEKVYACCMMASVVVLYTWLVDGNCANVRPQVFGIDEVTTFTASRSQAEVPYRSRVARSDQQICKCHCTQKTPAMRSKQSRDRSWFS
jgi:hypothetical protein